MPSVHDEIIVYSRRLTQDELEIIIAGSDKPDSQIPGRRQFLKISITDLDLFEKYDKCPFVTVGEIDAEGRYPTLFADDTAVFYNEVELMRAAFNI